MIRSAFTGLLIFMLPVFADAYEVGTHRALVATAASRSKIDAFLRNDLGLAEGLGTSVLDQVLTNWLADGASNEDNFPRFLNHFHNPLASNWSEAGLGGSVGQSVILWAQNPGQSAPGWSWRDVRQAYLDALTKSASSDRDRSLADTFEGLGRQMHFVQDAASPGHARNDPHILFNYESAVDGLRLREAATFAGWLNGAPDTPGVPDAGWQTLDANPLAPIAIARLIDADRYTGANPGVTTGALIGLAEYTNANFFSEDRIFTENDANLQTRFPFPNRASVVEQDVDVQVGGATVKRRYLVKAGDGASGHRLATVGFLRDYHRRFGLDPGRFREAPSLDEVVYRDYAERLVPRAVAYSTALLDYFFRGRLFVSGDDRSMLIRNSSDEPMNGTFTLYYDDAADVRRPVPGASWAGALAPGARLTDLQVAAPTNPAPKEPGKYMLVFRGALGAEPDAVAGTQVSIESTLFARLLRRKDGVPIRGAMVHAIDRTTGEPVTTGSTDRDGRVKLTWRPGRTILFIPAVNVFPMYWAGGTSFVSAAEGAHLVQAGDLDAQGQVTIQIPIVDAQWPEDIEACTGQPKFAHFPDGLFQESTPRPDGNFDRVSVTYQVNLITFIRDDDGRETILCGIDSGSCLTPAAGFVAEDVNRIGQVVGHLVRDLFSRHSKGIIAADGSPIGSGCENEYHESDVVPVTVVEP